MAKAAAVKGGRLAGLIARVTSLVERKGPIIWKYAAQELKPPTLAEIPQLRKEIGQIVSKGKSGAWKELTTYEVVMNAVVVWEIFCWFFVGEIIGKRNWRGYDAGFSSYGYGAAPIDPVIYPPEFCNYPPEK